MKQWTLTPEEIAYAAQRIREFLSGQGGLKPIRDDIAQRMDRDGTAGRVLPIYGDED